VLRVRVISPEASLYEGDATTVVAPAYDGQVGILTGHAPMMTLLGKGELRIDSTKFMIDGGFLQVGQNEVRVVTERGSKA